MKTNKAKNEVKNVEVTPSKKKLTQARLPFKLISEDASTPVVPQSRKRKLSADGTEPAPKGKICKENDIIEDLVIISDDESKDGQKPEKETKPMNPFVKLVDTAWKKRLQKTKSPKKRKTSKRSSKLNNTAESITETDQSATAADVEIMDVDAENQEQPETKTSNANPEKFVKNKTKKEKNAVVLEDSDNSSDAPKSNGINQEHSDDEDTEVKESKSSPVTPNTTRKSKSTEVDKENKVKEDKKEESETIKTPRKAKSDAKDKLNTSTMSAKLNESVSSNPSTPKNKSRSSSVTTSLNDSISESAGTPANLTPKQLQKKLESAKKKEEREKERQEREKKRQEEKEERARQKQEKEDAKKREREEKEEQKKKEKEEKEKQRELEKKLREEKEEQRKKEKEEKEEQRRKEKEEKEEQKRKEKEARDEEKRKKQEALELEKQEQELKKKKAAEAFVNFFVPKQKEKDQPTAGPVSQNSILSSFTIKVDMRLAPLVRKEMTDKQKKAMESLMTEQDVGEGDLYLKNLKKEGTQVGCSGKTWPLSDKDDDVMIIEDELPPIEGADEVLACETAAREKLRPKLFSFHENKRPPYWGTWRKKSTVVKPRRPFGQEKQLDYDADSDEDWEEEQEGESLDGSAAGSDDEPEDDYEVDNEVFVPHGYLSDEEATMEDEGEGDNVLSLSPETQKARLKNLEDEFESEMKKPTEKLKPRLYGLLWETEDGGKPEKCVDALWNYFGKLSMIMDEAAIEGLLQPPSEPQEPDKKKIKKKKSLAEGEQQSPKREKKKQTKVKPEKETMKSKPEPKQAEVKKNQPGINTFLTKFKSS